MNYKRALIEPAPLPLPSPPAKVTTLVVQPEISQDPETCYLFKLPQELRLALYNIIYEGEREPFTLTLNGNMPSCDWPTSCYAEVPDIVKQRNARHLSSLTRTCKTIFREASPELYRNIKVKMWFRRVFCLCDYYRPGEEMRMAEAFVRRAGVLRWVKHVGIELSLSNARCVDASMTHLRSIVGSLGEDSAVTSISFTIKSRDTRWEPLEPKYVLKTRLKEVLENSKLEYPSTTARDLFWRTTGTLFADVTCKLDRQCEEIEVEQILDSRIRRASGQGKPKQTFVEYLLKPRCHCDPIWRHSDDMWPALEELVLLFHHAYPDKPIPRAFHTSKIMRSLESSSEPRPTTQYRKNSFGETQPNRELGIDAEHLQNTEDLEDDVSFAQSMLVMRRRTSLS